MKIQRNLHGTVAKNTKLGDITPMINVLKFRKDGTYLLREYLDHNGFDSGDQLPPERVLAKNLGLTRARLRTALGDLEKEELIWRRVGKGTFMNSTPKINVNTAEISFAEMQTNPPEILEARLAVEPQITLIAAQRATGIEIDNLRNLLKAQEKETSWEKWSVLDKQFHSSIAQASKNQLLQEVLRMVQESQNSRSWGRLSDSPAARSRRHEVMQEHFEIFKAIESRDAQLAAKHMRKHLEQVRAALLGPFS